MKNKSTKMTSHLLQQVTTLCTCWRLTRKDGQIFRFTDHDKDVFLQEATSGGGGSGILAILDTVEGAIVTDGLDVTFPAGETPATRWAWSEGGVITSGKMMYEVKKNITPDITSNYDTMVIGIGLSTFEPSAGIGDTFAGLVSGSIYSDFGSYVSAGQTDLVSPAYIQVVVDFDAGLFKTYVNGVFSNQSALTPGMRIRPFVGGVPADATTGEPHDTHCEVNFGQDPFVYPIVGYGSWIGNADPETPEEPLPQEKFLAGTGYNRSAIQNAADLSADNLQVEAILEDGSLLPSEIRAGLFDQAKVEIYLVNWADPTAGYIKMRRGTIGELITTPDGTFKGELRGLAQQLAQNIGEVYQPECRADLGDSRCKVDLTPFTTAATITSVTNRKTFTVSYSDPQVVAAWFDNGRATFTSGDNNGKSVEIRKWTIADGKVELHLSSPFLPEVGDTVNLIPGCDKRRATCKERFNNYLNFRGEPFIPGTDSLLDYPDAPTS